jgi:phospholipid/cholesterol/gamma-HCH transport system substrate-binding protein
METNVNYTIVGIFVISIISVIILAIIWLSSGLSTQTYTIYKVLMQESVSGLSPDSVVEYNGVNVGSVTTIQINKKNPQIVEVLLKIDSYYRRHYRNIEVKRLNGYRVYRVSG